MERSILSTTAEKDCIDKVKSFIQKNRDAMEKDSPNRKEPENRKIDTEDLAREMIRAAELVWLAHLKQDMKNVIEQVIATGNNATTVANISVDNLAVSLASAGAGPATAVPAAVAPTVIKMTAQDIPALAAAKAKPLNIQIPDGIPIQTL